MSENNKINGILTSVKNAAGQVSEMAANTAEGVKTTALKIKDDAVAKQTERKISLAEKKRLGDLKKYSPIFKEDVANGELLLERFIRIVNYDTRLENEACKDSIGFYEKTDDRKLPTLYTKYVHTMGLTFYPQLSESVFVSDPCIPGKFIEIDEYYNYMKQVRVNELTVVAQALGAKSVSIELRNSTKSLFHSSVDAKAKAGTIADGSATKGTKKKQSKSIEIWASTTFKTSVFDGSPSAPELLYFRNESDISALIQMVLVNKSKVTERKYSMKASSSSGVSLTEAASISGTLKKIKCNAGASFAKSAENESKAFLDYTIVF